MSWRPGIRTEIVFILTVLVTGVAVLVGIVFLKVEERNLLQQKVKAGKQVMAAVEGMLREETPGGILFPGNALAPGSPEFVRVSCGNPPLFPVLGG